MTDIEKLKEENKKLKETIKVIIDLSQKTIAAKQGIIDGGASKAVWAYSQGQIDSSQEVLDLLTQGEKANPFKGLIRVLKFLWSM